MARGAPQARHRRLGYPALLNLKEQRHWTVFLSDFSLPTADVQSLKEQLATTPSRPLFLSVDGGAPRVLEKLRSAGVDLDHDYVSVQGVVFRHHNVLQLHELLEAIPRSDLARIELPLPECGFRPSNASYLLKIVMQADYREQEQIADRFFDLLDEASPYEVIVKTPRSTMTVRDDRGWFDITGRLRQRELRILPAGEVSYTGDRVSGEFSVDGAILPFPEHPDAAADARRLQRVNSDLREHPLRVRISEGSVTEVRGRGRAARTLSKLFEQDERYRSVTEVGIAFNRECHTFVHDWAAASNESRPGVHLGLGGDPSPDEGSERGSPLVHIDCIAGNCEVLVNRHPFLRASL
jgi:hypothetical protein